MNNENSEKKQKKAKGDPIKVVYIDPDNHNQYEVTDGEADSRKVPGTDRTGTAVAPSSYDRTAINKEISPEDLEDHPELKDRLAVGDIIDQREFNRAIGVEEDAENTDPRDRDDKLPIDPEINNTDEELNQSKG